MRSDTFIPVELQDAVERELEAGERVEWMGMPIPRYFTPAATATFLFGVPWTAFAVFWIFGAAGFELPDFKEGFDLFPLFGLPFILIGIGMLCSPLWAHRKSLRTVYVITDKRAICFNGGWSMTIRSFAPDQLQDIYRTEKRDGTGDVILAKDLKSDGDGGKQTEHVGFLRIRDPKDAEQRLKKLASRT